MIATTKKLFHIHALVEGLSFCFGTFSGIGSLFLLHILAHFLRGHSQFLHLFTCAFVVVLSRSFFLLSNGELGDDEVVHEWWEWSPNTIPGVSSAAWETSRELFYMMSKSVYEVFLKTISISNCIVFSHLDTYLQPCRHLYRSFGWQGLNVSRSCSCPECPRD